jgi:hypothetical protein
MRQRCSSGRARLVLIWSINRIMENGTLAVATCAPAWAWAWAWAPAGWRGRGGSGAAQRGAAPARWRCARARRRRPRRPRDRRPQAPPPRWIVTKTSSRPTSIWWTARTSWNRAGAAALLALAACACAPRAAGSMAASMGPIWGPPRGRGGPARAGWGSVEWEWGVGSAKGAGRKKGLWGGVGGTVVSALLSMGVNGTAVGGGAGGGAAAGLCGASRLGAPRRARFQQESACAAPRPAGSQAGRRAATPRPALPAGPYEGAWGWGLRARRGLPTAEPAGFGSTSLAASGKSTGAARRRLHRLHKHAPPGPGRAARRRRGAGYPGGVRWRPGGAAARCLPALARARRPAAPAAAPTAAAARTPYPQRRLRLPRPHPACHPKKSSRPSETIEKRAQPPAGALRAKY